MSGMLIVFATLAAMVAAFLSSRVPVALAALGAVLVLYFTGTLDLRTALSGFGDPTVLFIASLFIVSASLEASGVTAWVGQGLIRFGNDNVTRVTVLTTLLAGALTALLGVSGAVSALLPVVMLVSVRLRRPPSTLLMPLVFSAHAGSMLVLTASLVNVVASDAAQEIGLAEFGYFELSVIGIPLFAGTILIIVLVGHRLLPERTGRSLPPDLSGHSKMLADQYRLLEDTFRLEVQPGSSLIGTSKAALKSRNQPGLSVIAIQPAPKGGAPGRAVIGRGDLVVVYGERATVESFSDGMGLRDRTESAGSAIRGALFNTRFGYAEVMIPPRSRLIGQAVFPGMITEGGDLLILAVQRRGEDVGPGEVALAVGDTLLLQGTWKALDEKLKDPEVLVVDAPDSVRRQAVALGSGARRAAVILAGMVLLLATGAVPTVIAGMLAACATVVFRVLTVEQAFRAISGSALVMVASLIPLSTAMYETGAAQVIAHGLVVLVGDRGTHAVLAALFVLTATLTQLVSSIATVLIVIPVAVSAAIESGVSPRAALITTAVGAAACFLTPVASTANLIVQGPGSYRFGDYWKLGLPLLLWFGLIGTFLVPVVWSR